MKILSEIVYFCSISLLQHAFMLRRVRYTFMWLLWPANRFWFKFLFHYPSCSFILHDFFLCFINAQLWSSKYLFNRKFCLWFESKSIYQKIFILSICFTLFKLCNFMWSNYKLSDHVKACAELPKNACKNDCSRRQIVIKS